MSILALFLIVSKMKKVLRESDFQGVWSRFLKSDDFLPLQQTLVKRSGKHGSGAVAWELKVAHTWRKGVAGLRWTALAAHQEEALLRASGQWCGDRVGMSHKISDMSAGTKPFDCFTMWGAMAYVVVCYIHNEEGTDWAGYVIAISTWCWLRDNKKLRSLDEASACEWGVKLEM